MNTTEPTDEQLLAELQESFTQAVLPVTVFVGIETVLGFFGNILIIYVFSCRYHVCNFRYFVLSMALLDLSSCLTTMPGEMLTQSHWYTYQWNIICKVKSFFNVFTVCGVAFCLLTIAVDRYRKVCRPFGWQIKPHIAKLLCVLNYGIAIIVSIPVAILWGWQTSEKSYRNRTLTVTMCETDMKYKDTDHPHNYTIAVYVVLSISLLCMFVLYMFVARKLFRDKRKYYGTDTKMGTFMNSTYLAGASSDVLNSSSKPESSDSGPSRSRNEKTTGFNLDVDDENPTDDPASHDSDSHHESKDNRVSHLPHSKPKRTKKKKHRTSKSLDRREMAARVRRKTMIMVILTIVFILTTIMYITLLSFIAEGILPTLTDSQKSIYFFFFRFYFINHVINPLIYGIMDPHFRRVLMAKFETSTTTTTATSGMTRH